jgi:hypothetical protein
MYNSHQIHNSLVSRCVSGGGVLAFEAVHLIHDHKQEPLLHVVITSAQEVY